MKIVEVAKFIWEHPANRKKRLRHLAKGLLWQIRKRTVKQPKIITLANGVRFLAHRDCVVSSSLQYTDWPEYHEIAFCRRHVGRGDIVADVGANVGHFALLMSDVVGPENLICFEPMGVAYQRLIANFQLNNWTTTNVHRAAVGAENGMIEFPDPIQPDTTSSIIWGSSNVARATIPIVTLDSFFAEKKYSRLDCLKIDVEGYEERVFTGAAGLLRRLRPRLVMFESLNGGLEHGIGEILRQCDYATFQLDTSGSIQRDSFNAQNLFAAPLEVLPTFAP